MLGSLQQPPIVLNQSRVVAVLGIVFGLGGLVTGLTIQPNHWMVDGLIPAEWLLIPCSIAFTAMALLALVRPARLTLSPAGLEYRIFLSTRRAPWPEVGAIGVWQYGRGQAGVGVTLRSQQPLRLAGGWPLPTQDLAGLIEQARRHWAPGPR